MFRETNHNKQMSLFGSPSMCLRGRASKRFNDPSAWHNQFYALITSKIDEGLFRPLYMDSATGAPTKNICRLVAMMAYKEGCGCSDAELERAVDFDLQLRAALGLFDLEDAAPSIDSYYLFRRRLVEYEDRTGIDLYKKCFSMLVGVHTRTFNISGKSVRMDSKLIGSNIAWYSRYQLVHSTLCKEVSRKTAESLRGALSKEVLALLDEDAKNTVYVSDQGTIESKFAAMGRTIYKILVELKVKGGLLHRVFYEQYNLVRDKGDDGKEKGPKRPEPKDRKDIEATSLQNPNDPDAQFRRKGDQNVKGYSTNITETVDDTGASHPKPSIIVDVQVEGATAADNSYVQEAIEQSEACTGEAVETLYADGAYQSPANRQYAQENGVEIVTSGIQGRATRYELAPDGEGGMDVLDKRTGERIKAEKRKDKWRIPVPDGKSRYRYFSQEQVQRDEERRRLRSIDKERLNYRNNVEATIFQYSFHTRNNKTRYRGLAKHRMQAYARCMWMNFIRLSIFQITVLQRSLSDALDSIFALWSHFWSHEDRKFAFGKNFIECGAFSQKNALVCQILEIATF